VEPVDLRKIERSLRNRYLDADEVIFPVCRFVRDGMRLEGNYTGSSEWLVYGYVEKSAIVATFKISDLLQSRICTPEFMSVLKLDIIQQASSMSVLDRNWEQLASPMTYETGQEVGKREFEVSH
jgi:hypothetical protein